MRESSNKTVNAEALGINLKNIYRERKQPPKDLALKTAIETAHHEHPAYGHRRTADHLGVNHKRTQRIMAQFNLRPPGAPRVVYYCTRSTTPNLYPNLLKNLDEITIPHHVRCSDLTRFVYRSAIWYLATIEDIATRQIINGELSQSLPANGVYTWYVRGGNDAGWGLCEGYGGVGFTVGQPLAQVIVKSTPAQNGNLTDLNVIFSCIHDAEATIYEVYIAGPNGYISYEPYIVGTGVTCSTNCELSLTFPENGAYTWYVRGGNSAGLGEWNGETVFNISLSLPSTPTLNSPVDDAVIYQTNRPTFTWR